MLLEDDPSMVGAQVVNHKDSDPHFFDKEVGIDSVYVEPSGIFVVQ
jgi:hypothetical protein